MQYAEEFKKLFSLDPSSPTGLVKNRNGKVAGEKQHNKKQCSYSWIVRAMIDLGDGKKRSVRWTIPLVLYELYHGIEPQADQMIGYKDNNKDNLTKENLYLLPYNPWQTRDFSKYSFDTFRNVILSLRNPDYYKDPKDWEHPESLLALEKEKEKREKGLSMAYKKAGRPRKWN
ncbi:hypothetical protein DFV88_24855 [Salmonella enterica subsp. enterica serovar Newport]|nr:hypothetical protein [Salmonella enterica subsp. enterica serovar Newport]